MQHRAKKSLGQNFLKNESVIQKIGEAAELSKEDTVLEIGPGLGALTRELLRKSGRVVVIEKDDALFANLDTMFGEEQKSGALETVHGDVMEFDPSSLKAYKLVANIPYNITGAIIEKFLSAHNQPSIMVLMVQKEVAERIVAIDRSTGRPGKGSILSNAVKVYGVPTYVTTVKAGNFSPAPAVDSAVIKIANISRSAFIDKHHEEVFFQIMKAGFAHKRKILAGNLRDVLEPATVASVFAACSWPAGIRAEDVGIDDWILASRVVYNEQYAIE